MKVFPSMQAHVLVTIVTRLGWSDVRLTLAQFAKARSQFERLDVCFVSLEGSLL